MAYTDIQALRLFIHDVASLDGGVNPGELAWRIRRHAEDGYRVVAAAPPVYASRGAVREAYGLRIEDGGMVVLLYPAAARVECGDTRMWVVVVRPPEYEAILGSRGARVEWVDEIDYRGGCYALTHALSY